ncbi:MAG: GGDEF domain-containing protein [Hungatella sp.]|nr:GGDEF domain-containing protein [Hungatella sp.]
MKISGNAPNPKVLAIILPISVLLILILVTLYKFGISSNKTAITIVEDEIEATAEGFSSQICEDLDNMTRMGIAFRDMIVALPIEKPADTLPLIGTLCANSQAYMVVYCDTDGVGVTQNGIKVNVEKDELLQPEAGDAPYYAYIQKERIMQAEAVISVIPVVRENTVSNYILMYYSVSRIKKLFHQNKLFNNANFIFSVDNGVVITTEGLKEKPPKGTTITQLLKDWDVRTDSDQLQMAIKSNKKIAAFTSKTYNKYVICTPVGINDWYITIGFDKKLYDDLLIREWGDIKKLIYYLHALIITFVIVLIGTMIIMRIIYNNTNKKLIKQANMDLLTGLYNKMATESRIMQYIMDYPRAGGVLFILDIDNFKNVNDSRGHAEGDAVLKRVGHHLKEAYGDHHVVGRIGGDEFIIFVKDILLEQEIEEQIKKMRECLQALSQTEGNEQPCTFSAGASLYPNDAQDFSNLYKAADMALYEAKKNGKNQLKMTES